MMTGLAPMTTVVVNCTGGRPIVILLPPWALALIVVLCVVATYQTLRGLIRTLARKRRRQRARDQKPAAHPSTPVAGEGG